MKARIFIVANFATFLVQYVLFEESVAEEITEAPPELPVWCYDPSGEDCAWYRECLVVTFVFFFFF